MTLPLPAIRRFLKAVPVTGETKPLIDVLKTQLRRFGEYQSGEEPAALAELKLMIMASVGKIERVHIATAQASVPIGQAT